jgi:hypothetical protein
MVEQYPDTIVVLVKTEPVQDVTTGAFTDGTTTTHTLRCRAEKNTEGKLITGADGNQISYDYTVYLPKMDTVIPIDSEYTLTKGLLTARGRVKDAINGQLNSRLWL